MTYLTNEQFIAALRHAIKAVIAQGRISLREDGNGPAYRGADGLKCAVGHLLPDESMVFIQEGWSAIQAVSEAQERMQLPLLPQPLTPHQQLALHALQRAHDKSEISAGDEFVRTFKHNCKMLSDLKPYLDGIQDLL